MTLRLITPARLFATTCIAALLTAAPVTLVADGAGLKLEPAYAHARNGSDDSSDHDRGDDKGGDRNDDDSDDDDDHSGHGGSHDDDDDDRDDDSNDDDDSYDDSGHHGRGHDDRGDDRFDDNPSASDIAEGKGRNGGKQGKGAKGGKAGGNGSTGGSKRVAKIEASRSGIEVTYADGSREEIENGRYERKDRFNNTIVERPARKADYDRLNAL